jgi:phospholipid/cholesterol/gamma-HCH transport system permease protein
MLSISAWGFAGPGLQAGNFLVAFGSIDRSGGFMVVAIVREFGTYVTATVVAGIVGSMFTAELGTRKVRGELDALTALGVDPIKDLVAPRVLAITLTMIGLDLFAPLFGVVVGILPATALCAEAPSVQSRGHSKLDECSIALDASRGHYGRRVKGPPSDSGTQT